jgi:hypothetical protein
VCAHYPACATLQEATLEKARFKLKQASARLNVVYRKAGSYHLLFLVLFSLALFMGVYMLSKMYRISKGLLGG